MRKCFNKSDTDDYLLNRMSKDEREDFEAHYFSCPACFNEMIERNKLISVIKEKGQTIFQDIKETDQNKRPSILEKVVALFSLKQWIAVSAAATLILFIAIGIAPHLKKQSPQFFISDDLVRGESITLISPVFEVNSVPSQFTWKSSGKAADYKISIYNSHQIWTITTENTSITLPETVQAKLVPGEEYSWQVKSFSSENILIAVSKRVQFQIIRKN